MREESENSVGLPLVKRVVEEIRKLANNGRVDVDQIPFEFLMLVDRIYGDMSTARFGNHYPSEVNSKMPFVERLARGRAYSDTTSMGGLDRKIKTFPMLYINAVPAVADEWAQRVSAGDDRMISEEDCHIGDWIVTLVNYVKKNGLAN